MTESQWNLMTNALLLVTVLCLWIGKRRERRKADEDLAAMRGKWQLDRVSFDNVKGRP